MQRLLLTLPLLFMLCATAVARTIDIVGAEFKHVYYEATGDWYITVVDARANYGVRLDYYSPTLAGTYTLADFNLGYSYLANFQTNPTSYVQYEAVDLTVTEADGYIDLECTITGDDGNVYHVTAHETPVPEPLATVEQRMTTLVVDDYCWYGFFFASAKNDHYDVSLSIASEQVPGSYDRSSFEEAYSYMNDLTTGLDLVIIDWNAEIRQVDGKYVVDAELLSDDLTLYRIHMTDGEEEMSLQVLPAPSQADGKRLEAGRLSILRHGIRYDALGARQ